MNKTRIVWGALILLTASLAYASTFIGKVTAEATANTDEPSASSCCPHIGAYSASTGLMRACKARGGSFFKSEHIDSSSYCGIRRASPGAGWKYECAVAVEADCYR